MRASHESMGRLRPVASALLPFTSCLLAIGFLPLGFFAALSMAAPSSPETPRRPEELKLEELQFAPIKAEQVKLPCGILVILHENHDLPILDLTLQFRMGTRYLPVAQHTACELFSDLWREGGTANLPPDSLDAVLTALDARITARVDERRGSVDISLSSEDAASALPIWRDVALEPRFDSDRLVRAKANRMKELQGINNDPGRIAAVHLDWLLLGRDFPGARIDTRADIEGATVEQIRALHARFARPENAIIGVSGDFDRKKTLALLERLFRDWPASGPYEPPAMEPWTPHPQPGVYLLRGDYAQSQIRLGRMVPDLIQDSPDYPAAEILGYALGYGRVFYRTREEGLTYGSAVMLSVGEELTELYGFGSCRGDATIPLVRAMLGECRRLKSDPIAGTELEASRLFQIGGEVRSNETAAAIVRTKVSDALRGRPDNYRETIFEKYKTTSSEEVDRLARTYVATEDPWVVLVLGNPEEFGMPLDSLGFGAAKELEAVVFGE